MVYTWKAAIIKILEDLKREATAQEIYDWIKVRQLVTTQEDDSVEISVKTIENLLENSLQANGQAFYKSNGKWGLIKWYGSHLSNSDTHSSFQASTHSKHTQNYTWKSAAEKALQSLNREASVGELLDEIKRLQLRDIRGKSPDRTLYTQLIEYDLYRVSHNLVARPYGIAFYQRNRKWGLVTWLTAEERDEILAGKGATTRNPAPKISSTITIKPRLENLTSDNEPPSTTPHIEPAQSTKDQIRYTWKSAIIKVLEDIGHEATALTIYTRIMEQKLVETRGKTPYATLTSRLHKANIYRKSPGENARLFYKKGSYWGLAVWLKNDSDQDFRHEHHPITEKKSPSVSLQIPYTAIRRQVRRKNIPPKTIRADIPLPLTEWEKQLAPQVKNVQLLGEISLTEKECRQLGGLIGIVIQKSKKKDLPDIIRRYFPASYAMFMVSQGIYYGSGGSFWKPIETALDRKLDANWHTVLGEIFEQVLTDFDLPLFPDMTAESFRFVSLILAHGGIPNYSLNDYFEKLLLRAVTKPWYADMDADELIDEWLNHSSYSLFVDRPVLRFLEYGEQVAEDFVNRSREMAQTYLESGILPDATELSLPERVVSAFQSWAIETNPFEKKQRKRETQFRLSRPTLQCDPWGEGIYVSFPRQHIFAVYQQSEFEWQIEADGTLLDTLSVNLTRNGYDWRTESHTLVLTKPVKTLTVSFIITPTTGEAPIKRYWRYNLFDPETPLIVFDANTGTLIRRGHSLPAKSLWLLYPENGSLSFAGTAYKTEDFPLLPWDWQSFSCEAWDLYDAEQLTYSGADGQSLSINIRPSESSLRPQLSGGKPFYTQQRSQPTLPLYIGEPPFLLIPLVGRTSVAEELTRWTLKIQSVGTTEPSINRTQSLSKFSNQLKMHQMEVVELPLETMLGTNSFGTFELRIRGPLGRDAALTFRLLPQFDLIGHEKLFLPAYPTGPEIAKLLIETDRNTTLKYQQNDNLCKVWSDAPGDETRFHQVEISPEVTTVTLTALKQNSAKEYVQIPVHLVLRRLQWTIIANSQDIQSPNWSGRTLTHSIDEIEQFEDPLLLINLGYPIAALNQEMESPVTAQLVLRDVETNQILQTADTPAPRSVTKNTVWRFSLNMFYDTIKRSSTSALRLELQVMGYPDRSNIIRCIPLNITQHIAVSNVKLSFNLQDNSINSTLMWDEASTLRNRRLRIWSLWQPWRKPIELSIPDEARGQHKFTLPASEFPLGQYLFEFFVVDPWTSPAEPKYPSKSTTNTAIISLLKPAMRITTLESSMAKRPTFAAFLEIAIIRNQLGQPITSDLKVCLRFLAQASISQIQVLYKLIEATQDKQLLAKLETSMFSVQRIERVLHKFEGGEISQKDFEAYFSLLPKNKQLPLETCRILRSVPLEKVQMLGAFQLIGYGDVEGVQSICQLVKEQQLTEEDAVTVFKIKPHLAAHYLEENLDDNINVRLLKVLSKKADIKTSIVSTGYWIYTKAGWGVIKKIVDLQTGREVGEFLKGQDGIQLHLILRPLFEHLQIELTIHEQSVSIKFPKRGKLFRCTKTRECRFISHNRALLEDRHNSVAHGGLAPTFVIERKTKFLDTFDKLKFRSRPPYNSLI